MDPLSGDVKIERGRITQPALSFLQQRGVLSKAAPMPILTLTTLALMPRVQS